MKITIEAEPKEIAALVRELQGKQKTELHIDPNGSIESTVGVADSNSKVSITTGAITVNGKISGSTIEEINKELGGLAMSAGRGCV